MSLTQAYLVIDLGSGHIARLLATKFDELVPEDVNNHSPTRQQQI